MLQTCRQITECKSIQRYTFQPKFYLPPGGILWVHLFLLPSPPAPPHPSTESYFLRQKQRGEESEQRVNSSSVKKYFFHMLVIHLCLVASSFSSLWQPPPPSHPSPFAPTHPPPLPSVITRAVTANYQSGTDTPETVNGVHCILTWGR